MATMAKPQGPTAQRIATNVRELRRRRGLDLADLADRMTQLGQPISVTGLSKLENGTRRVDVDDLVALAIALDVSPNRLLLPAEADDGRVELTPEVTGTRLMAWRWAAGEQRLPLDMWAAEGKAEPSVINLNRARRWSLENRPHDPPDDMPLEKVEQHRDVLVPVSEAIRAAQARGLPMKTILAWVRLADVMGRIAAGKREDS